MRTYSLCVSLIENDVYYFSLNRYNGQWSGKMFDDDTIDYYVVVNDEEQYSIWPASREVPNGWSTVGSPCGREDALNFIEEVWTDMRPKSLRAALESRSGNSC
jgi:MbtH protein